MAASRERRDGQLFLFWISGSYPWNASEVAQKLNICILSDGVVKSSSGSIL